MSRKVRLEPAAVQPGAVEQMTVRLDEPSVITGVKLDEPESFDVLQVIAGRNRASGTDESMALSISPPNAFVIVLVKSKLTEETKVCGGDLVLSGEAPAQAAAPTQPLPVAAPPPPAFVTAASVAHGAAPGTASFKVDTRGWPLGGSNEVWVLMGRGEAERLVQAINGYPITAGERPGLLRRFHQAFGLLK